MEEVRMITHMGGAGKSHRVPSTVQFPYSDVSDAIAVAHGVLKGGGLPLSRDQLAAAMGLSPNGGGFATKIATARTFGVIESQGGKYQLTDLGHEIVDPARQGDALVSAFLNVELYKRVFEEFRGKRLPPRPHGLEAAFVNFGVSPKNAKPARLAFDKSARMAGFFPSGDEDRLVMPFGQGAIVLSGGGDENALDGGPAQPTILPSMPSVPAPSPAKALEYELVDLLKTEGIGDAESEAIWTLVRFLTARKRNG
jgi:hypothetical protein